MRPHSSGGIGRNSPTDAAQTSSSPTNGRKAASPKAEDKLTRPTTAPTPTSGGAGDGVEGYRKKPKISIKDIWGKDGGNGGTSDLLDNLEASNSQDFTLCPTFSLSLTSVLCNKTFI